MVLKLYENKILLEYEPAQFEKHSPDHEPKPNIFLKLALMEKFIHTWWSTFIKCMIIIVFEWLITENRVDFQFTLLIRDTRWLHARVEQINRLVFVW